MKISTEQIEAAMEGRGFSYEGQYGFKQGVAWAIEQVKRGTINWLDYIDEMMLHFDLNGKAACGDSDCYLRAGSYPFGMDINKKNTCKACVEIFRKTNQNYKDPRRNIHEDCLQ